MPKVITTKQILDGAYDLRWSSGDGTLRPGGNHVIESSTAEDGGAALCKVAAQTEYDDDPAVGWLRMPAAELEALPTVEEFLASCAPPEVEP